MLTQSSKLQSLGKCIMVATILLSLTDCLFIPLVVYRLCYQSTTSFIQSQCVNCPFLALQGYSFSCFGNTAFPRNMTPAQAQCMIQRCQDGVRQTPVFLGRKKRADDTEQDEANFERMQVAGQIDVIVDTEFDYEDML